MKALALVSWPARMKMKMLPRTALGEIGMVCVLGEGVPAFTKFSRRVPPSVNSCFWRFWVVVSRISSMYFPHSRKASLASLWALSGE